jgi:hypothetical protein
MGHCIYSAYVYVHIDMYLRSHVSTCKWPCIHVQNLVMFYAQVAVFQLACDCVSTCMWQCIIVRWLCIYMHVALYPRAHGLVSTCRIGLCTRISLNAKARVQNFVLGYGPPRSILLCPMGHSAEWLTNGRITCRVAIFRQKNFSAEYGTRRNRRQFRRNSACFAEEKKLRNSVPNHFRKRKTSDKDDFC